MGSLKFGLQTHKNKNKSFQKTSCTQQLRMQNKCLTILTLGCPNIRGWPGGGGLGGAASFFSPEIRAERPKNDRPLN